MLIYANETLLPVTRALDHLADLLRLLLIRERTDPVTRNDVLENGELGEKSQFANQRVVRDRVGMGGCRDLGQGKRVKAAKET